MRSIRRSLIGYFLVLTLVALTAMGVLLDQISQQVVERGRADQVKLVDQQFEDKRKDEVEKLDQALFDQAYTLAVGTQWNQIGRRLNQAQHDFSRLEIAFGVAGPLQAATISAITQPGRRENNTRNPIHDKVVEAYYDRLTIDRFFLKNIDDDQHFRDMYQMHRGTNQEPWRSKSLGAVVLPLTPVDFPGPTFGWKAYEGGLPDGTQIRRVVLAFPAFGRPQGPGVFGPAGPGPGHGFGGGGRRGGRPPQPSPGPPPSNPTEGFQRLYVQAARPLDALDPIINTYEQERIDRLAEINDDAGRTLKLVRMVITVIVAAVMLAVLLGSLVLTRRGLVPLDRLSAAVSRVSEKDFQLPVRVEELSTELAPVHARLTATLDALKAAFEREKQSVADISHELRTPIAALGVTLDVALKKSRTPEQYQQTLKECREINTQLGKLVERIMTLATLDAGTARTAADTVDAADLAAGCATIIKPLAEAHGVTLSTALARPLPVTTDPDKLREVLMNLLHNAVEYNRPGGVIELKATGGNGHGVTFDVRDTGIGMTPDVRAKIFERFYRADPSRTATGVHAGLGLAIVKEYVARLGGSIAVDSTPDVGSTFRVTIPSGPNGAA
jgi:signal transduction histidine kinase